MALRFVATILPRQKYRETLRREESIRSLYSWVMGPPRISQREAERPILLVVFLGFGVVHLVVF